MKLRHLLFREENALRTASKERLRNPRLKHAIAEAVSEGNQCGKAETLKTECPRVLRELS